MLSRLIAPWVVLLVVAGLAGVALAQNEGQADLDAAVDAKLDADSPDDLSKVINLCESALSKGLDEENKVFAERLLASTLFQRGNVLAEALLFGPDADRTDPRLPQVYRQCLADARRATSIDPTMAHAQLLLGKLYALNSDTAPRAGEALEAAIKHAGDEDDVKAEALITMSSLRADPEVRLKDLDEAIKLAPQKPQAYRLRAMIKLQLKKPQEALDDLDAAIKLDPDHAATHEARGMALTLLERLDEAKTSFSRAAELAPDSPALLLRRAQVAILSGDFASAEVDTTKVLEQDEGNLVALLLRGEARVKQGKHDEALADVDRVLELRPSEPAALRLHALVMASQEKIEAAIADLEAVRLKIPTDAETIFRLGMLYGSQKRVQESIDAFTAVLRLVPDNQLALRARAGAYLSIGRQQEAIQDYEQALKQNADDNEVLNNLAWVLSTSPDESLRDGKRAIELATKACELTDYKQAHILSTLAAGYAETGDFETAIKWSTKAVELADDDIRDALNKELASYKDGKPWRELQTLDQDTPANEEKDAK